MAKSGIRDYDQNYDQNNERRRFRKARRCISIKAETRTYETDSLMICLILAMTAFAQSQTATQTFSTRRGRSKLRRWFMPAR